MEELSKFKKEKYMIKYQNYQKIELSFSGEKGPMHVNIYYLKNNKGLLHDLFVPSLVIEEKYENEEGLDEHSQGRYFFSEGILYRANGPAFIKEVKNKVDVFEDLEYHQQNILKEGYKKINEEDIISMKKDFFPSNLFDYTKKKNEIINSLCHREDGAAHQRWENGDQTESEWIIEGKNV